jgi:hypothetical protein
MTYRRAYHSAALLLPDGSVLIGGDPNGGATPNERFLPSYFSRPRPTIANTPANVGYGGAFSVDTSAANTIGEVVLMRPAAVTHGFNQAQRFISCAISGAHGTTIDAVAPPDGTIAPPGHYLLFVVDSLRVPSRGVWTRLS